MKKNISSKSTMSEDVARNSQLSERSNKLKKKKNMKHSSKNKNKSKRIDNAKFIQVEIWMA